MSLCERCAKSVKPGQIVRCEEAECNSIIHENCLSLLEINTRWRCEAHLQDEARCTPQKTNDQISTEFDPLKRNKCEICNLILEIDEIFCFNCNKEYHKACAISKKWKISRNAVLCCVDCSSPAFLNLTKTSLNTNNKDLIETALIVNNDRNVTTPIHSIQTSMDSDNTSKRDRHVDQRKRSANNREFNNRNININERGSYNSNNSYNMTPRNTANRNSQYSNNHGNNSDRNNNRNSNNPTPNNRRNVNNIHNNANRQSFIPPAFEEINTQASIMLMLHKANAKDLPMVDRIMSWRPFYTTYMETKSLFSLVENYNRVQAAIKDKNILRIGGVALTGMNTFEAAMNNIDRRLKTDDSPLIQSANALKREKEPKHYDYEAVILYVDKILDFESLAWNLRDKTFYYNTEFIIEIVSKLPREIKSKWTRKYVEIKERSQNAVSANLGDLSKILRKEISILQANAEMQKISKEGKKPSHVSVHTGTTEEKKPKLDKEYCWFHKNREHPTHKCKDLWKKDGKEVTELAKKAERCLICGQERHNQCPWKESLICNVKDCDKHHHALYCFKRKVKISKANTNNLVCNEFIAELNNIKLAESDEDNENTDEEVDEHVQNQNDGSDAEYNHMLCHHSHEDENDKYILKRSTPNILGVLCVECDGEKVNLMIDTGCDCSLIDADLANKLKKIGPKYPIVLRGSCEQSRTDDNSRVVELEVNEIHNKNNKRKMYFRTIKDLKLCPQRFFAKEFKDNYPHLKDLKLFDYKGIHGIIGNDQGFISGMKIVKGKTENDPVGFKTCLGDFIIHTKLTLKEIYRELKGGKPAKGLNINLHYCYSLSNEEKLEYDEFEKEVLDIIEENNISEQRKSADEVDSLKILTKYVKKEEESNRYVAPLLWKDENIDLGIDWASKSEKKAISRFFILEKVMRNNNKKLECDQQVKSLLLNNYAVELDECERKKFSKKTNYIPIFFISPDNKRTRMIWDLAAKIDGKSLNDHLLQGPNLYNNILKIQFQMREFSYLFAADLKEMFHQVKIQEEDTDALRFVYKFDNDDKLRHYKMKVLPFGAKCSPTIAQYVRNMVADNIENELPRCSELIKKSTYVDDIVTSVNNKEELSDLLIDLKENFGKGGFNMLKININNEEILAETKEKFIDKGFLEEKQFSEENDTKILGYWINFKEDMLNLKPTFQKVNELIMCEKTLPSRREVLRVYMSIYDPIGFTQYITSNLKLFYHELIKEKMNWDDIIPKKLEESWKKALHKLTMISNLKIPRMYMKEKYKSIELHAFGDAGKEMLCGVIHFRFLDKDDQIIGSSLVYAKTFIVPAKENRTIPENELQIAAKLIKMVKDVKENHRLEISKTLYYSDSSTIITWIKNGSKKPSVYIRNRLKIINENSKTNEWYWIPTDLMPADPGTKIKSNMSNGDDDKWFYPEILKKDMKSLNEISCFNIIEKLSDKNEKADKNIIFEYLNKYNKFSKIVSNIQSLFRFTHWLKTIKPMLQNLKKTSNQKEKVKINSTIKDQINKIKSPDFKWEQAKNVLIKKAQQEALGEDYNRIINKKNVLFKKGHDLHNKIITTNDRGVIQLVTRFNNDDENCKKFGYGLSRPTWLPKHSEVTRLIILHYHEQNKHILMNSTIASLKKKYYIKNTNIIRNTIKKQCIWCKRHCPKMEQPLMGDLPNERLGVFEPPFTYSMVDLAGPVLVKLTRNTNIKRWIMVYTCLTTRAVHLEIVEDLTTNATLMSFENIMSIRGKPKKLFSDCGTNFIGGNNLLKNTIEEWNKKLVNNQIDIDNIDWIFGPAKGSHFQGAVERLIGITKTLLRKIELLKEVEMKTINDFGLKNIISYISNMLNNRPLCMTPMNEDDTEYLTPNHFLITKMSQMIIPKNNTTKRSNLDQWKDIKEYMNFIWNKFIEIYLPTIEHRNKWILRTEPLKVGDVVIACDSEICDLWRLGRIVKVIEGSKGQVRQVEIKLGKTNKSTTIKDYVAEKQLIITRPANKVARINVE